MKGQGLIKVHTPHTSIVKVHAPRHIKLKESTQIDRHKSSEKRGGERETDVADT